MTAERREQMINAVSAGDGMQKPRDFAKNEWDQGQNLEFILEDLEQIRLLVASDNEDNVLDVMDLLTGWSAPQFQLGNHKEL